MEDGVGEQGREEGVGEMGSDETGEETFLISFLAGVADKIGTSFCVFSDVGTVGDCFLFATTSEKSLDGAGGDSQIGAL